MQVVSIGEILWDLIGGREFLGGAPFNLCAHLAQLGHVPYFVSAVGQDERGRRAKTQAGLLGLDSQFITETGCGATGISAVTLDAEGKATHNLPRPAAYDFMSLSQEEWAILQRKQPKWICFGTLAQMELGPRGLTQNILRDNPASGRFYDVNLRPRCWTPDLVETLLREAMAAKLNEDEVAALAGLFDWPLGSLRQFSELLARRFELELVCVTRGESGCCLWRNDEFVQQPGLLIDVADTVGAGDAFSAALLHGLDQEWPLREAAAFANRVGALVASRPGATPAWTETEARGLLSSKT
jgi:fructokinase